MPQKTYTRVASTDTETGVTIGGANDVPFYQGDDSLLRFVILDGEGGAEDVTNATIQFRIASDLSKDTSGDVTIVNATEGLVEVPLSNADTNSLSGSKPIDLKRTDTDNEVTLLEGTMTIAEGVA